MGSFSILHWAVPLVLFGGIAFAIGRGLRREAARPSELKGIGGWLAWLAVGQVFALLIAIGCFALTFEVFGFLSALQPPAVHIAFYARTAMAFCYLILVGATTMALFRKKKYFTELFLCQWITFPVLLIVATVMLTFVTGASSSAIISPEDITAAVIAFGLEAVWVWYTHVSKRVANTMVN